MVNKHTPGKWLIDDRTVYALQATGVNRFSASVQGGFLDDDKTRTPATELEANAHLIAAAPDLLAACEALGAFARDLLKLMTSEQIKEAGLQRKMLKVSDQGFNAIAKAKGGL